MRKMSFLTLIIVAILFIAGCGSDNDGDKKQAAGKEKGTVEASGEVEVNLYSGEDRPTDILDGEHKHYEPVENADYDTINYVDENIFISAGSGYDYYSNAFALETGERIWDEDTLVNIASYFDAPMYDDELYYTNGDERGKITYATDPKDNEALEIDEEEYDIRAGEHVFEENSYIVEGDETKALVSYDMATLDEQWEVELSSFSSARGRIVETGDYVFVDTSDFHVYIIDKETGEVVFEEDDQSFYETALQVDDTLYLLNINGLSGDFFTLYALDTNTWEKEEIVSDKNEQSRAATTDYVELVDAGDRLVFMYEYGLYIIDTDQNEIQNFYHYDDPDSEGPSANYTTVSAFIHDDQLYTLSDHAYHKSIHVIDIATGEVLQEHGFGDIGELGSPSSMRLMKRGEGNQVIEKINDESFVIVTRDNGIYEFDFTEVNK